MCFYASVRRQVKNFLSDDRSRKIEIDLPKNFKLWLFVGPCRYLFRSIILFKQRWMVPSRFKNWYLRLTGMKVGKDVCIPHYIHFDSYFPQLIKIDDGSLIGGLSSIRTHEIKDGKLILGRVHIKEKTLLAGLSNISPGVTIGKNVITGTKCHISKDCPDKSFVVGNDKVVKFWDEEDMKRLFHKSERRRHYYEEFRMKTQRFREDKDMMLLRILNDGKRLNPGNEWYLARPTCRIYYNAIFVELARVMPSNRVRICLWNMMGAKIGKNVKIGKGTVFDHIYGDLVEIGNNVRIGRDSYLDGHSYTIGESVFGRIKIGNNVRIGDRVHIMCGVKIDHDAKVLSDSSVLKDIGEGETWQGIPAKRLE